jgi:hypothetical protein
VERTTIAGETEELGENLPQRHFVPPQKPKVTFEKGHHQKQVNEDNNLKILQRVVYSITMPHTK